VRWRPRRRCCPACSRAPSPTSGWSAFLTSKLARDLDPDCCILPPALQQDIEEGLYEQAVEKAEQGLGEQVLEACFKERLFQARQEEAVAVLKRLPRPAQLRLSTLFLLGQDELRRQLGSEQHIRAQLTARLRETLDLKNRLSFRRVIEAAEDYDRSLGREFLGLEELVSRSLAGEAPCRAHTRDSNRQSVKFMLRGACGLVIAEEVGIAPRANFGMLLVVRPQSRIIELVVEGTTVCYLDHPIKELVIDSQGQIYYCYDNFVDTISPQ
jgi:hypothetical protein